MDDLIKLANFRVKITNETAEDPRLDLQAAWIVISVIELDGPRLECVTTFFNYDRITSISFRGPSKLERAFRRGNATAPLPPPPRRTPTLSDHDVATCRTERLPGEICAVLGG